MNQTLWVRSRPTLIRLQLGGTGKAWVVAMDPTHPNSHYYRRAVYLEVTDRHLTLPLPVTPERLQLEVFQPASGGHLQARILEVRPLPKVPFWAPPTQHRFMEFAIDFACQAGYLAPGFYPSPAGEFLIQYLPTITNELGQELITPARIHQLMPRVQLSQKQFRRMSIPRRVKILSHEYCHYLHNTRSEQKADQCGIDYYAKYGFPRVEGVYSLTKVFRQNPEALNDQHTQRVRDVMAVLDQYPNRFPSADEK